MTTRIRVPTFNSETDDYEKYKNEIEVWKVIGKVDKKEQALLLVYELKKDDPSGIREKVLSEVEIATLKECAFTNKTPQELSSVSVFGILSS